MTSRRVSGGFAHPWSATRRLLTEDAAALLRRLSVFEGPASLEQIEGVCGNGAEVLEALAQLVDVALVALAGDERFLLHAAVRSYACEKLAEADESEVFQRRHAAAFAETATWWGRRFLFDVDAVQAEAAAEEADLGRALRWASEDDRDCFARLAGGAAMTLVLNTHIAHWRDLIEEALQSGAVGVRVEPGSCWQEAWPHSTVPSSRSPTRESAGRLRPPTSVATLARMHDAHLLDLESDHGTTP